MTKKKKSASTKNILLEHSKVKVQLFSTYLSTYLNIISRVRYYNKIHIYDLLCGEGKYGDGSEGSPIAILKTIKNHYFSNDKSCPDIDVWLNDNGNSDVEKNKKKIQRVEEVSKEIFKPTNVNVIYSDIDYEEIYEPVLQKVNKYRKDKHLIFIDPHGYKNIKLHQLVNFLSLGNTEIILFLPLFDMYRFANKSYDVDFKGGNALRSFMKDCFGDKTIIFNSVFHFCDKLKDAFINKTDRFVDTFLLEKDKSNYYSLFFFTPSVLGFEKMLEAKWKIDDKQRRGFTMRIQNQSSLFESSVEVSTYPYDLENYLKGGNKTNKEVYLFGLKKGYLPSHTIEVLKPLRNNNRLEVTDLNGSPVNKNGYYLNYDNYKTPPKKEVIYSLKK